MTTTIKCHTCDDGTVTANVIADVEGDAGVIGGLHAIYLVEDMTNDCGCVYDAENEQNVMDELVAQAEEDYAEDGPDPDEAYDRMREDALFGDY